MRIKEEIELLEDTIEQVKVSHKWLLRDIKMRFDSIGNPGNYSDELKHAI